MITYFFKFISKLLCNKSLYIILVGLMITSYYTFFHFLLVNQTIEKEEKFPKYYYKNIIFESIIIILFPYPFFKGFIFHNLLNL